MKSLYLIRGCPGSGKSLLAKSLSEQGKYPVLSADMYFEDYDGNYNFDPTKLNEAHEWCKTECETWMRYKSVVWVGELNQKIFVANTFTQEWEMEPYFQLAEKYGYTVFSIIVENRHGNQNTHNVPDEKVQQMKERFQIKL